MKRKAKRYDEGGSVMDMPVQDMRDPAYRKSLERSQALETSPVGPEDLVGIPLRAVRGIKAGVDAVKARRVKNVFDKGSLELADSPNVVAGITLGGRNPKSVEDITHAYRNMSSGEIEAAKKAGYFGKKPADIKRHYDPKGNKKWWSAGDETGNFGRNWARDESVRVPYKDVSPSWAVKTKNAQRLNKETGEWEPFKKGGKVSSASKRGDGIAQRGKTKGRMV